MAKLKEFNGEDDWEQYCERLEFHFEAHEITNGGKKKATLLSVCGAQTYKLMCDLVAPLKPKDKTFDELKDVVQKHLKPRPSAIVQRYKFNTRGQQHGESVACFVAGLRHIAHECNFGDQLLDMLCDRLVCGLTSERMQRRLLSEPNLTFENAFSIAIAMETADKNASELQTQFSTAGGEHSDTKMATEQVNKISREKAKIDCWFCEKYGHREDECRLKQKLEKKLLKEKKKKRQKKEDSESDSQSVNFACGLDDSDHESYPIYSVGNWYVESESDGGGVDPSKSE